MKILPGWKLVSSSLKKQVAVMILLVVESSGSSPGRAGFFMVINSEGEMEGSLGGGIMEHKFIEVARARLQNPAGRNSLHKQIHNKTSATHQSGMICSGEQTNLLYLVKDSDELVVQEILKCVESHASGLLKITPVALEFCSSHSNAGDIKFTLKSDDDWTYTQTIGYLNRLYIIGGGHCSLALSRIMSLLDFYIILFEERKALKTMNENEFAHEKEMVEDYSALAERIPSGKNHYVVIMTYGYRTDALALQALDKKELKYLGVLGSRSKIGKMFSDLYGKENSLEKLEKIHAPVGLPIKSHTPEEVAISIAAEIIKIKNE